MRAALAGLVALLAWAAWTGVARADTTAFEVIIRSASGSTQSESVSLSVAQANSIYHNVGPDNVHGVPARRLVELVGVAPESLKTMVVQDQRGQSEELDQQEVLEGVPDELVGESQPPMFELYELSGGLSYVLVRPLESGEPPRRQVQARDPEHLKVTLVLEQNWLGTSISMEPPEPHSGEPIKFSAELTLAGRPCPTCEVEYEWRFPEGPPSTAPSPTFTTTRENEGLLLTLKVTDRKDDAIGFRRLNFSVGAGGGTPGGTTGGATQGTTGGTTGSAAGGTTGGTAGGTTEGTTGGTTEGTAGGTAEGTTLPAQPEATEPAAATKPPTHHRAYRHHTAPKHHARTRKPPSRPARQPSSQPGEPVPTTSTPATGGGGGPGGGTGSGGAGGTGSGTGLKPPGSENPQHYIGPGTSHPKPAHAPAPTPVAPTPILTGTLVRTGTGGSATAAAPGTPRPAPNHGLPGPASHLEDDQEIAPLGWIGGALLAVALVSLGALLEWRPEPFGRRLQRP